MNTNSFIYSFHGEEKTNFRAIKDKSINLSGTYKELQEELNRLNADGYNIYFTVNSGGTHSYEINKINAVFIDFDRGKDGNNQYFSLEITEEYKRECINRVGAFECQPSFIVETRNGIHVYWLVNESASIDQFKDCQLRLINYFNSDKSIKTAERIMRLPDFNWVKDINNPFMCKIVSSDANRYDISSIINYLLETDSREDRCTTNKNNNNTNVFISGTHMSTPNNISYITNHNIQVLQQIIKPPTISFNNHEEVYAYLKKQDLNLFLGLPKIFKCIFHSDNNPSANIFIDPNSQYFWYKCFSSNCGVLKDIISITENLLKCSTPKALRFLRKVYNITYYETEWQKEAKEIFEENKRLLYDTDRLSLLAPETYKRIKNYIPILILLNDYALTKVFTDNFIDGNANPLFFSSIDYLKKVCNCNDHKNMTNRIALFSYLGLLNKLSDNEIPDFLLKEAKQQALMKQQHNRVGYYSIPSYCDYILTFSELKSKEFKDNSFTMRGLSREMILRTLGEKEADRVYPQMEGKKLGWYRDSFADDIENTLIDLLKKQRYVTENQILNYISGNKKVNKTKLKRVLPDLLNKLGLAKVKLNKELKNRWGVSISGYPYVIYYN
jgi:hypothetical protein